MLSPKDETFSQKGGRKMKKILKQMIFFLVVIATLSPVLGQAFNPAAHVYIASKVARQVFPFTFDKVNLYYGSIAPDISSYATGNWANGFCETHYGFTKLPYAWWNPIQKAFAQGWQIHSEIAPWGADYYAHWAYRYSGSCPSDLRCMTVISRLKHEYLPQISL
jgi:hypothetical protein